MEDFVGRADSVSVKQSFGSFLNIIAGDEWRSHAVPTVSSYRLRETSTKKEQEVLWHYASEGEYKSIHRQSSVHPSVLTSRLLHSVLAAVRLAPVIHAETTTIAPMNSRWKNACTDLSRRFSKE